MVDVGMGHLHGYMERSAFINWWFCFANKCVIRTDYTRLLLEGPI